jgi:hypothetical protein
MVGARAEEAESTARARREEVRDDSGGQGADRISRSNSTLGPFKEMEVGDGRQADDADVPSAFEPTEEENEDEAEHRSNSKRPRE